jgi:hypothetical protein
MNAIFTNGIPAIPGIHSAVLPTNTARKIASHTLYADGASRTFGARTLMPRGSIAAVTRGTGSMAIAAETGPIECRNGRRAAEALIKPDSHNRRPLPSAAFPNFSENISQTREFGAVVL